MAKACSTFCCKSGVYLGESEVQSAFENNFEKIKNEEYLIDNVRWIGKEEKFTVYLFDFHWKGIVHGNSVSGNGVGTPVLVKDNHSWKLLTKNN
ncbi:MULTISPECIES: nuclear transport factor 2 family protein [Flavobacteriaceae]|uniref:nuclear transport factor 2 family protein n=1 Tax=Flavobacteriaceae TaxID=49546 RepID=UPI0014914FC7|nr:MULTISPECIES: nuclear transport factor 2 family protein [Allomuricauda]MDC6367518.1 nuclear transport factor 2 family protein [Muricauda sp. AC10]